jgi:hypothetical protein
MTSSLSYRFWVAVLAGLVGLTWAGPVQATCLSAPGAGSCGATAPMEVCRWNDAESTAVCSSHHASQEALTIAFPSPDTQGGRRDPAELEDFIHSGSATVAVLSVGAAIPRVNRRHVYVGVWLE